MADGTLERLLSIDAVKANGVIAQAIGSDPFVVDIRIVPVNSERYGGSGGGLYTVVSAGHGQASELVLHELGHSFSRLGDEYGGSPGAYVGNEPKEANLTMSPTGDKWSRWIGYEQPGIGVIDAYEGGGYYDRGIYRPSANSKCAR